MVWRILLVKSEFNATDVLIHKIVKNNFNMTLVG